MKPTLQLDIFVAGHVDDMYDKIRQKFLQQVKNHDFCNHNFWNR